MRKTFILILALVGMTRGATAQFSFGPGVGFNYAVHTSSNSDETFSQFGLLITSQFDLQFSRLLGLLVWADYSNMSLKESTLYEYEYKINYLHLSPTIKFCIPKSHVFLYAGPGLGIKTEGRYKTYGQDYDIPDMNIRLDARLGAGYDFFLSKRFTLSAFAAFNIGLNNVAVDTDWKISALQGGIVLRYNTF
jgi:hypothetical protein